MMESIMSFLHLEIEKEKEDYGNGTNELARILYQKTVFLVGALNFFAFRRCGHLCLSESCYSSLVWKWICVVRAI